MSTFIQQTLEPSDAQPSLQSPWLGLQPTGTIDPLLDRAMALTKVGVWSCDLSDDKLSWSSGVFDLFGLPIVFAERLSGSFPKALLAARIGGDEFAVIVTNEESPDVIEVRIARFLVRLRAPILWRGHMLTVGVSSGLAVPTDPYSYDPEELFIRADAALYANKKKCR